MLNLRRHNKSFGKPVFGYSSLDMTGHKNMEISFNDISRASSRYINLWIPDTCRIQKTDIIDGRTGITKEP